MALLINLFGAPGSGKSTIAMSLAGHLKAQGFDAEFAPEYIKTLIALGDTSYTDIELLANQFKQIKAFYQTSEVVVTDSPILLAGIYAKAYKCPYAESLAALSQDLHNFFSSQLNFLVLPCSQRNLYKSSLRLHNYEQSTQIFEQYFKDLLEYDGEFVGIDTSNNNIQKTLDFLTDSVKHKLGSL